MSRCTRHLIIKSLERQGEVQMEANELQEKLALSQAKHTIDWYTCNIIVKEDIYDL